MRTKKQRRIIPGNKKITISILLVLLGFSSLSSSIVGWAGINNISRTIDTDRIEFKNYEIENRADIEVNKCFKGYSIGLGYGRIKPMVVNEFIFRGAMKEENKFNLGIEVNYSKNETGFSLLGSQYIFLNKVPILLEGEIAFFKDYGRFSPGLKYYHSKKGYIGFLSGFIDIKDNKIKKMVGLEIFHLINKKCEILTKINYSTKNGYELLFEPRFRAGNMFFITFEGYIAKRNNSAFGISLVYSPLEEEKKVVKKPVVIEKPKEKPEEKPEEKQEKPIKKNKKEIEKPIEEKPEEIQKSPEELKNMLNDIVNGPYTNGINFYCEDKFEEAINEWETALGLLRDKSFANYKEVLEYIERCHRNIENAKNKLKIIRKE